MRIEHSQDMGKKRTGAGTFSTIASGEGSTAGVTSIGLSSDLGTAGVVVGSDIMLWEGSVGHGLGESGRLKGLTSIGIKTKRGRESWPCIEDREVNKEETTRARGRDEVDERERSGKES